MGKYQRFETLASVFDYCRVVDPGYLPDAERILRVGTYEHPGSQNGALLVNQDGSVVVWNFENPELRGYWAPQREKSRSQRSITEPLKTNEERKSLLAQKQATIWAATARKSYAFYRSLDGCYADHHPYLKTKKVKATSGMRQCSCEQFGRFFNTRIDLVDPLLIIPLTDGQKMQSLQLIDAKGNKRFLTHGKKKGCYWLAQWIPEEPKRIIIAEGVATALSIKQYLEKIDPATPSVVLAAMDCGNMAEAAKTARKKYGQAEICIFADNDRNRAGIHAAIETVSVLGCQVKVYYPEFTRLEIDVFKEKTHDALKMPTDFNDKAVIGIEKLFYLEHPYLSRGAVPQHLSLKGQETLKAHIASLKNRYQSVQEAGSAIRALYRKFCKLEAQGKELPQPPKTIINKGEVER